MGGVGGVVCGEYVDGAVFHGAAQGLAVCSGAQGRADLGLGIVALKGGFIQQQIVGAGFGGHLDAARLAPGDAVNGQRCGNMGDMHGHAKIFRQHDVAHGLIGLASGGLAFNAEQAAGHAFVHAPALCQLRVFAVVYEHQIKVRAVFHDAGAQAPRCPAGGHRWKQPRSLLP